MFKSSRNRRGAFTLVELLVVIGIIAVLIGILLPTINSARQRANTTACAAALRNLGQCIYAYSVEFKGSVPFSYYTSGGGSRIVGESDGDAADKSTYVWWSVLRRYMRKGSGANWDNSTLNQDGTRSTRFMAVFACPTGQNRDAGCDFGSNMAVMPENRWETVYFRHAINNPVRPGTLNKLPSDLILLYDACELAPNFDRQYVTGYDLDDYDEPSNLPLTGGTGAGVGQLADPKNAPYFRYRDDLHYFDTDPAHGDGFPIAPGSNRDKDPSSAGANGFRGNIRWRHGKNNQANFLFADGTVKTLAMTTGYGTPNARGDVLRRMIRPKWPPGFSPDPSP